MDSGMFYSCNVINKQLVDASDHLVKLIANMIFESVIMYVLIFPRRIPYSNTIAVT